MVDAAEPFPPELPPSSGAPDRRDRPAFADGAVQGDDLSMAVEAILFLSDEPVSAATLAQLLEVSRRRVETALDGLGAAYQRRRGGIVLQNVAGGWRLTTNPDAFAYVEQFVTSSRHGRLTRASLEVLAIVAYKQPVTRFQVSSIRGVSSEGVLRSLVDRGLLEEVGRDDGPGRALLYGTTAQFLERMGLASLSDLPPIAPLLADAGRERAS
jgi:segregation and condensation protein B